MSPVSSTPATWDWTASAIPISLPSEMIGELRLIFMDSKRATSRPRFLKILHKATYVLILKYVKVINSLPDGMNYTATTESKITTLEENKFYVITD